MFYNYCISGISNTEHLARLFDAKAVFSVCLSPIPWLRPTPSGLRFSFLATHSVNIQQIALHNWTLSQLQLIKTIFSPVLGTSNTDDSIGFIKHHNIRLCMASYFFFLPFITGVDILAISSGWQWVNQSSTMERNKKARRHRLWLKVPSEGCGV